MPQASKYYLDFDNDTDRTWTMAVYQTLPNSVGLQSVSWKQTTAPRSGNTGVTWDVFYNVTIGDYRQDGGKGVYKASQTLDATLGTQWQIVYRDGVQQLEILDAAAALGRLPSGPTSPSAFSAATPPRPFSSSTCCRARRRRAFVEAVAAQFRDGTPEKATLERFGKRLP